MINSPPKVHTHTHVKNKNPRHFIFKLLKNKVKDKSLKISKKKNTKEQR